MIQLLIVIWITVLAWWASGMEARYQRDYNYLKRLQDENRK